MGIYWRDVTTLILCAQKHDQQSFFGRLSKDIVVYILKMCYDREPDHEHPEYGTKLPVFSEINPSFFYTCFEEQTHKWVKDKETKKLEKKFKSSIVHVRENLKYEDWVGLLDDNKKLLALGIVEAAWKTKYNIFICFTFDEKQYQLRQTVPTLAKNLKLVKWLNWDQDKQYLFNKYSAA